MLRSVWRGVKGSAYRRRMGMARKSGRIEPVRRPAILDEFPGEWVAIKDGRVIAHAVNSRAVVQELKRIGTPARGAVLQRAAEPAEAVAVGLG